MSAVDIAVALAASRKAVRLYPPEHPTHREAIETLCAVVTETIEVRPLTLNLRDGRLYEGSEVITEASPATRSLIEAMEARRVESLTFHMGFAKNDAEGLSEVLSLRPSPDLQVQAELEDRDVRAATVSELEDNSALEAEERDRRREADRSLYRGSLTALKHTLETLKDGELTESVEITRTVALIIERVAEDTHAILALAMMTGHGEWWRFHAVSVMLHSLVLGQRIGLSDREMLSLGLAALLHDTGRILSADDTRPSDQLEHPITGAHALGALRDDNCATIIVAYEHHMGADGSGWPEREVGTTVHPYSRIVAIANRYDNLIRPAEGQRLRPDQAAAQLLQEASGGPLDPMITLLFVQAIGAIPIGSVVRLSDNCVGIVQNSGEDPLRPQIRLILAHDGTELRPAADVELADEERAIVEVMVGELLDLQVADYL